MPAMSILSLTLNFCPISLSLGTQYSTILLNYIRDRKAEIYEMFTKTSYCFSDVTLQCSHQVEVSVLCCSVFGWHLFHMTFFDEFICRVNNVLFSSKPFVNLQQLVHFLLKTRCNRRMKNCRNRKGKKTLKSGGIIQTPPEGVIFLSAKTSTLESRYYISLLIQKHFVCLSCFKDVWNTSRIARQRI